MYKGEKKVDKDQTILYFIQHLRTLPSQLLQLQLSLSNCMTNQLLHGDVDQSENRACSVALLFTQRICFALSFIDLLGETCQDSCCHSCHTSRDSLYKGSVRLVKNTGDTSQTVLFRKENRKSPLSPALKSISSDIHLSICIFTVFNKLTLTLSQD